LIFLTKSLSDVSCRHPQHLDNKIHNEWIIKVDFLTLSDDINFMAKYKIRTVLLVCAGFLIVTFGCAYHTHEIMGSGSAKASDMASYLQMKNNRIDSNLASEIALIYLEEARAENINHDVAFAQMCIETGFLSYGGTAGAEQFNFCGLGVFNTATKGESFTDMRMGVRAHIQHLKAYASPVPPVNEIVDPRYKYVKKGSAKYVYQLTGKWATDPAYGRKVDKLTAELREYSRKNSIRN